MIKRAVLRTLALLFMICMFVSFAGCDALDSLYTDFTENEASVIQTEPIKADKPHSLELYQGGNLEIYFIDVGQGDSALLISPTGQTMLIDAGERAGFTKISLLMESLGIDSLDAAVATHPHSDHIGGMADVINNYEITDFYMPDFDYDTKTYQNMTAALHDHNVTTHYLYGGEGVTLDWDEYVTVECLSPLSEIEYDDANNVSIMLKITYGNTSAMFTGDCERYAEASAMYMLPEQDFSADVLKVGHHGSSTSSHDKFLQAVHPEYAVISCGYENSYGHPHDETLTALEGMNARILRTDELGTVHVTLDGKSVTVDD